MARSRRWTSNHIPAPKTFAQLLRMEIKEQPMVCREREAEEAQQAAEHRGEVEKDREMCSEEQARQSRLAYEQEQALDEEVYQDAEGE